MPATYRLGVFLKGQPNPILAFQTYTPFANIARGDTFDARPQGRGVLLIDDVWHSMLGTAADPVIQTMVIASQKTSGLQFAEHVILEGTFSGGG